MCLFYLNKFTMDVMELAMLFAFSTTALPVAVALAKTSVPLAVAFATAVVPFSTASFTALFTALLTAVDATLVPCCSALVIVEVSSFPRTLERLSITVSVLEGVTRLLEPSIKPFVKSVYAPLPFWAFFSV